VILEASSDKVDAVGEQRRRKRVTGQAFVASSVVLEGERLRPVDDSARGQALRLASRCVFPQIRIDQARSRECRASAYRGAP
jgi:hypothetical protein